MSSCAALAKGGPASGTCEQTSLVAASEDKRKSNPDIGHTDSIDALVAMVATVRRGEQVPARRTSVPNRWPSQFERHRRRNPKERNPKVTKQHNSWCLNSHLVGQVPGLGSVGSCTVKQPLS